MMNHESRTTEFRRLHELPTRKAFLLPNAWDALSARALEVAGAEAIGTTSGGISWALGSPDGQRVSRAAMVEVIERIANAVTVPVTADIESGYGPGSPGDVARTVEMVIRAGAVGINLEDAPGVDGEALLSVDRQRDRISAARAAAKSASADLFINARIDTFLRRSQETEEEIEETIRRAQAYLDAGADGVFVPGTNDLAVITKLAARIDGPLNIMASTGSPPVAKLQRAGARRVSIGAGLAQATLGLIVRAGREMLLDGEFGSLDGALPFPEADAMFS